MRVACPVGKATATMTVTRGAVCCARCGWHQLELGICWSIDCPNVDSLNEGVFVDDAVEVELDLAGVISPMEYVGDLSVWVDDVEATFEGKPFVLTEEEEDDAGFLLVEAYEDGQGDDYECSADGVS